jgi:hypothetical protein
MMFMLEVTGMKIHPFPVPGCDPETAATGANGECIRRNCLLQSTRKGEIIRSLDKLKVGTLAYDPMHVAIGIGEHVRKDDLLQNVIDTRKCATAPFSIAALESRFASDPTHFPTEAGCPVARFRNS